LPEGKGTTDRDLVACVSAFDRPDPGVVLAALRVGALGLLDLGHDEARARAALGAVASGAASPFGVRVPGASPVGPGVLSALPATPGGAGTVDTVVLGDVPDAATVASWAGGGRRVLVEVRTLGEARAAEAAGAGGLVARGSESGGRVGEETSFVLLSHLIGAVGLPVWAAGGIGIHTAAGAVAAGAAGVVLDSQLALAAESTLPEEVRAAVRAMDGSETVVLGGTRVYYRPDLPSARPASDGVTAAAVGPLGGDDLHTQLLPTGQDAAFAAAFAARWPTVGAAVEGLRRQIAEHLGAARRCDPLAPGAPFAAAHGLRYPIAQGPMTRVSDRAEFAAEVAAAGALPFLALALMPGHEVRALLEDAAARLGDRPWGVGILGFVPPEVRQEQLEAIHDIRPPVALIAGGRPSQSRPLEEAGIATYLHVPSPGLLQRFLKDGARRFVFEGRECGGHVGPRSSFALWEAQIETLLASGVAGETSVLFAGGVHDARSAAVVAATGAPLAEAGARIGVLMGSAYLFTEEAVRSGAIVEGFQQAALACDETVLLETSPGHATRCAETEYVRAFRAERERLAAAGADAKEAWAALEMFNLGRLRVAAKGLVHAEGGLAAVGPDVQRREGMYMLGQVAALHTETITLAALHEDVSAGSSRVLEEIAPRAAAIARTVQPAAPPPADVAIVGMACFLPGATDAEAFWSNVVTGADAVTEVPPERWDAARYYDPEAFTRDAGRKTPSKWGGFLPDVAFDALAFGIPPRSLAAIEPVQLLSLQVAADALADAGYGAGATREFDRERVSVIFGAEAGTDLAGAYGFRALAPQYLGGLPDALDAALPELTEDSFPGLLTNVIAGRIANRLDLGGVNFTVDAACASSLAAVDAAVKELAARTSDMVLCGGADLHNGINDYLLFAAVHALSPSGRCASFDASADGIALGEGVACVVLKRLADAERDGDRIYAVIEGIAGSSDGRSLGLTAPRPEGQRRALDRAYAQARVDPAEVGLVEAHGTGTVVGDRTELAVLTELFADAGAAPGSCTLGSVKSQIGHTKCVAGLAALIKAARALHHGVLPPTIHLSEPNPGYDPDGGPFALRSEARPWAARRRVAGVSAFGFGGTNFHAVLRAAGDGGDAEESAEDGGEGGGAAPGAPRFGFTRWPAELFLIRAEDPAGALDGLGRLEGALGALPTGRGRAAVPSGMLADLAAATCGSGSGPVRVALVAGDLEDLGAKLAGARAALEGGSPAGPGVFLAGDDGPAPDVAFLFPGQGSQRPGMLADLFVAFPHLQRHLRRGAAWTGTMFPPTAFDAAHRRAQADAITDTRVAQPTLGMADLAMADLLGGLGVRPDLAAGHSYGELVALTVAGALAPEDLFELSAERAEAILAAAGDDPGAMAAVSGGADEVLAALGDLLDGAGGGVVLGNDNGPGQVVISGPTEALEKATARLAEAGLASKRLPVACAFHSPVVAGAAETFGRSLAQRTVASPALPVWSNTTAQPYPSAPAEVRRRLAEQVARPVRFREQVEAMYDAGARIFVEVGPGKVLTGLVGRILGPDRPHTAIAVDASGKGDLTGLLTALARLAVTGVPVDTAALFEGRTRPIDLAAPVPSVPGWVLNGHLVRTVAGPVVAGALPPANEIPLVPLSAAGPPGAVGGTAVAEATVVEYLRSLREMVAAGREVMLGFLGAPAAGGPVPAPLTIDVVEAPPAVGPAERAPVGAAPATADAGRRPAAMLAGDELRAAVLGVVSERTGYPLDMLDPTLDLEADLSIDSIKRLEIVAELADRVGLSVGDDGPDESVVEELVGVKTLDGIVAWLEAAGAALGAAGGTGGDAGSVAGSDEASGGAHSAPRDAPGGGMPGDGHEVPERALRFIPRLVRVPAPAAGARVDLTGRRVVVTDDGTGVAESIGGLLREAGAEARVVGPDDAVGDLDVLVHLSALGPAAGPGALAFFERAKESLAGGVGRIVAVTATGGTLGMEEDPAAAGHAGGPIMGPEQVLRSAGMRGVAKTVAREHPEVVVRLVDLERTLSPAEAAAFVMDELTAGDQLVEVGRTRQARSTVIVEPAVLTESANGSRPADAGPDALSLGADAVVVVTGGGRGVTSWVSEALARQLGCTLVLVGRTPEPTEPEDALTAGAPDAIAIRRALAEARFGPPAAIEAETRRLLAARELGENLASIRGLGVRVDYRSGDLRDPEVVQSLLSDVYTTYGRLDGIVHGAGTLEDARLVDKTSASFRRVFETKVTGVLAVSGLVRPDVKFIVLFASVSGVWGNRGQVDYAAANDALAEIARRFDRHIPGRVVAIDWGPWAGGGMVSPELEREFNRRGIGLLDPADAVGRLLAELRSGDPEPEVIYMRAEPERFG
jgi:acyl transferase domain-containing protein/NAD(P)H-dependent flavin oxidoreductase YrpB (nitropropane dioxygenase family)